MNELNGSFGQADGLVGTLGTYKSLTGYLVGGYGLSLTGQLGGSLIPGPKGDKGDKGDRGDTGATGPIGPAGPQGDQGPQGETGPKGEKGDTGERGEKGDTGPQGPRGETGDTGPKGDRGPKGDKGDPGDDYTLTDHDKQDIAGLVDIPVDDVQINGTSILQNGVANIPKAGSNTLGVVLTQTGYGITINSNGKISTDASTSAQIKTATDGYGPLTPNRQHESTFYGLAKSAGHDEKDSTLPVGTYTEEAKTAIRTMLGLQDVYDDYSSALTALGVI